MKVGDRLSDKDDFFTGIFFDKAIPKKNLKQYINELFETMLEIKSRVADEGFKPMFQIFINGRGQHDINVNVSTDNEGYRTHKYKGIGYDRDLPFHFGGTYKHDDYVYCRMEFLIF